MQEKTQEPTTSIEDETMLSPQEEQTRGLSSAKKKHFPSGQTVIETGRIDKKKNSEEGVERKSSWKREACYGIFEQAKTRRSFYQ